MKPRARLELLSIGLCGLIVAGPVAAQERVGVAGAVNPAATGQPPGVGARTLLVGTDVVFNEKIVTSSDGQVQILFLDRSAFSVGPNSEIVIDEFVYDPKSGNGKLAASVTKGVFRFVGGALSKNDNAVSIKSPSATIGIRGGMLGLNVAAGGPTTVLKIFGNDVTLTTASGTQRIVRNDFYQTINAQGQFASSAPGRASQQIRQSTAAGLNPQPGANGGSQQPPNTATLAASGFSQTNSADVSGAQANASARTPTTQLTAVNVGELTNSTLVQAPTQIAAVEGDIFAQLFKLLFDSGTDLSSVLPGNLSLTDVTQIPITGSATFGGPVIGAAVIDGVRKLETSASFAMTWSFASNAGFFQIINFANSTFFGTIGTGSARNVFTGTLVESGGGSGSGVVTGAFYTFSSPADIVAGSFTGTGRNGAGVGFFKSSGGP